MLTLIAQTAPTEVFPTWVLGAINLGMLGVNFYLYITRRQLTPGEMTGRLEDQKTQYESRINDLQLSNKTSVEILQMVHSRELATAEERAKQERERADRYESKLSLAQELMAREMIPAMAQGTSAIERSNDLWTKRLEGHE